MSPKVSVVIPTKNGGVVFSEVMEKLASQSYPPGYEILVLDSGSTDNTVQTALNYGARVIGVPPLHFNHGETRDFGIKQASGEIIVLITQDATPLNNQLIANLVKPFEDLTVAGTYARQIPRSDADILTKRNLNNWLTGRTEPEARAITDKSTYEGLSPIERYLFCNFDNVCSAVRKEVWKRNPFGRHDFGEDIAWSKHVLEQQFKIVYQPSAAVVHSHNRPISYEYKRTYLCHRKLYSLFGLCTVPSLSSALMAILHSIRADSHYVLTSGQGFIERTRMLIKIPALSVASVLGQYRGARDEKMRRGHTPSGV